jgi:hypothetical protein
VRLVLLLSLLLPTAARAESWIVFPIFAEVPPPRDPTLMRMSRELLKVIRENVSGEVRLAKRDERQDSCPIGCPEEIASMLSVDHVVAMHLKETQDQLAVILYEPSREPEIRKVTCNYANGAVSCDSKALAEVMKGWKRGATLEEKAVHEAFEKLESRMIACGPQEKGVSASARFRVRPDGRVTDVRIDPIEVQDRKPYDCMARVLESLRVPPFTAQKPVAFQLPLPGGK